MGIGKKITKGSIGSGVNIAHKSKMSQSAKNQMSFPGGMPGPGQYGKVVGKGMMKYLSGEPVGMGKYKSDAQRKAAHASMAEGAGKYGKHMGPEKELVGKQKNLPEELKKKIEEAPGKYGHKKGPKKADYDSEGPAKERTAVKSVNEIDSKKDNYSYQKPVKTETLKEVKKPRKASKEIAKSKIEAGKKLKKEGRQEKRAARKNARKIKRSARLDKKIALQEFKGKQKVKSGDQQGAKAKRDRVENLKARKAKK